MTDDDASNFGDELLAKQVNTLWHTFRRVELYRGAPEREAALKDELVNHIPTLIGAVERLYAALTESERVSQAQNKYIDYLSVENARLRAQIAGTVDDD